MKHSLNKFTSLLFKSYHQKHFFIPRMANALFYKPKSYFCTKPPNTP